MQVSAGLIQVSQVAVVKSSAPSQSQAEKPRTADNTETYVPSRGGQNAPVPTPAPVPAPVPVPVPAPPSRSPEPAPTRDGDDGPGLGGGYAVEPSRCAPSSASPVVIDTSFDSDGPAVGGGYFCPFPIPVGAYIAANKALPLFDEDCLNYNI